MKQCHLCNRTFSRSDNLLRHQRNYHQSQDNEKTEKSETCSEAPRQEYWDKDEQVMESDSSSVQSSEVDSLPSQHPHFWEKERLQEDPMHSDIDSAEENTHSHQSEDSDEENDVDEANDKYLVNLIVPRINHECRSTIIAKSQPYIDHGESEEVAECKAINESLDEFRERALHCLADMLMNLLCIDKSPLYRSIMKTVQRLSERLSLEMAVKEALILHKLELGPILIAEKQVPVSNT